jgi:hypothetical protein
MRASAMRLLHLMTVRALGQSWGEKMIVRSPRARAPLGMSSFWIRHIPTSFLTFFFPYFLVSLLCYFNLKTHTSRGVNAEFLLFLIVS